MHRAFIDMFYHQTAAISAILCGDKLTSFRVRLCSIGMLQLITAHRKARCTNAEVKLNSDSVFLLRSFLEMLVVLGFTMSKEFYRLSHFIDQDILRQRGRFVATNNIELLQPPCAEMYDNIYLGSDVSHVNSVCVQTLRKAQRDICMCFAQNMRLIDFAVYVISVKDYGVSVWISTPKAKRCLESTLHRVLENLSTKVPNFSWGRAPIIGIGSKAMPL